MKINKLRREHELPMVTKELGWRYHHMGIPTTEPIPNERYIPHLKMYVSGFDTSPYGLEWMRFEEGCPVTEIVRTIPHIAFEVDDLDKEIQGKTLLGDISHPSKGVRVAMFIDNGAPVELIEFLKKT